MLSQSTRFLGGRSPSVTARLPILHWNDDVVRADAASATATRGRRVCMVVYSFYESDNRVLRYAEALAARGDEVEVLALRRNAATPAEETIHGVRVLRIQDRFEKNETSRASFIRPLLRFLLAASWRLSLRHRRHPYDLVHVHNVPDFLVFAAWYPKLTGARVILDVHDIVPEFFASKFGVSADSGLVKALRLMEKMSAAFADHVVIANHLWLEKYTTRSARAEKCSVFINHVDQRIFHPGFAAASDAATQVVMFPGGLQWHQGLDLAIRAFAVLRERLPATEFHIYGDGGMKPELKALARELGLDGSVRFFDPLRLHEIAPVMARADLGVVPKRADSFGDEAYSTKIMEFMSVRVPVVVSGTKVDRFYFNDSVVRFFESGNVHALADAMFEVLSNEELRRGLVARASAYAAKHSWENRKPDYLNLVDSLCERV